jgi:hypothetical protein
VIRSERPRGSLRDCSRRDLDQGDWSQRLSRSLQSGIRFLRDPLPDLPWALLTVGFPRPESRGEGRAYHVPRMYLSGLGCVSPPVARHLRQGTYQPLGLATCPFWPKRDSLLRLLHLTTVTALQLFNHATRS